MINKGIKRGFLLICVVALLVTTSLTAVFADTVRNYKIKEIGLTVSLPAYMNVITRETSTNDEVYKKYGTSGEDLTELNMYLVAYSADTTQTLSITVTEDDNSKKVKNYNTLSESQLNEIKDNYSEDKNCQSCTIETYNDLVYFNSMINMQLSESSEISDYSMSSMQCDTLIDGKYYHFNLISADGAISDDDKELMTSILESAVYDSEEKFLDANIIGFIGVVVGVLVLLVVFVLIISHTRKKKLRKRLKELDDEIQSNDRRRNRERDRVRKNRQTATGAERPDAFFDGVDGYETSANMDKIERDLIREAHRGVEEYSTPENTDETKNTEDKIDYSEFFDEYEKTKNHGADKRKRSSRNRNSRRNKNSHSK